jgi:hypothetical protein
MQKFFSSSALLRPAHVSSYYRMLSSAANVAADIAQKVDGVGSARGAPAAGLDIDGGAAIIDAAAVENYRKLHQIHLRGRGLVSLALAVWYAPLMIWNVGSGRV